MTEETITTWISHKVTIPFIGNLDKRMKRIVAIASLFGYLFNRRERNKEIEIRLSKIMNLTNNPGSLTLPIIYHRLIWRDIDKRYKNTLNSVRNKILQSRKKTISITEARQLANLFVLTMPEYLYYDTVDNIKSDVVHMIEALPYILDQEVK